VIDPMVDPMGSLIVEIRDDFDVDDLVDRRVRGGEPAPQILDETTGEVLAEGDARGPGEYIPFIVLTTLSAPPEPRVPLTFATYGARSYGVTPQNAWAVYGALVKAIHNIGPRLRASGVGIYNTLVISGGEQDKDPDTKQPVVTATIRLVAATQAVAV
jgi:hypothetical protein